MHCLGSGDRRGLRSRELTSLIGSAHRFTGEHLLPYRVLQVGNERKFEMKGVFVDQLLRPLVERGNVIFFEKTVHKQNVDWSLGAALSKLPLFVC